MGWHLEFFFVFFFSVFDNKQKLTYFVALWIEFDFCNFGELSRLSRCGNTLRMSPFPETNTTILRSSQIWKERMIPRLSHWSLIPTLANYVYLIYSNFYVIP